MTTKFTHLHFHTHYSLMDGSVKIKGLGRRLKEIGYDACAITDHGNLHGAVEFHNEMKKEGIKALIGMEAYIAKENRFHRRYSRPGPNAYHTVLICENKVGYNNLAKLSSLGYSEGKYYGKPRIDSELLEKHREGLFVMSACLQGELARRLLEGKKEEALERARWHAEVFPDRYYVELQNNGLEEQNKVNPMLIEVAAALNLPLIGSCDCHYLNKADAEHQHILQLIGWQKKVTDPTYKPLQTRELYLKTPEEVFDSFKDLPEECLSNTAKIAELCDLDLSCKRVYLPEYPLGEHQTLEQKMTAEAERGLEEKLSRLKTLYQWSEEEKVENQKIYGDRLKFELSVINKMGYPGYFLIVSDFIKWAKQEKIPVGPGRGSGAGSLVAYSMEITDIDPIKYDLLFERFLNPERVSMPDFDIDFEVEGRERVIEYVKQKYGEENVCQISAIGSLKAKGAIRGVARALDIPYDKADKIAKLAPDDPGATFSKIMKDEPQFQELAEKGSETEQKLISTAIALEGVNTNLSTHAAGVIIMDNPISDIMPVCTPSKGDGIQSQYTMNYAEEQGAVKFDFLGLRNLSIIDKSVDLINKRRPSDQKLDITLIPMDDQKTFQLLCRGDTTGVFQLESEGMKTLIRKLKPDCFEDIIALVALYRPGPLGSGMVDDYVERKHGRQKPKYPHPNTEKTLSETYGVMVYQEQVMRTVQALAGFSLGQADILRRAIGKKKPEVLKQQRHEFVSGCFKHNNINEKLANHIFDLIDKFAGYGFNKSHSAAYALISYQTAWLKANYPIDFMAALLTVERNKPDSVVKLINECREMNIPALPPDINASFLIFTPHQDKIRFGLNAIKNVGEAALESILRTRDESGPFNDLSDFVTRIDISKVNSRVMEALIKSGAFDSLESNRRKILEGLDTMLSVAHAQKSAVIENQISFFDMLPAEEAEKSDVKLKLPDVDDWKTEIRLKFEKESLGFYISGHPLRPFFKEIQSYAKITRSSDLKENNRHFRPGEPIYLAGVIVSSVVRRTKKAGKKWASVVLEDLWGSAEVMFFPKNFAAVEPILNDEEFEWPVLIEGKINANGDSLKVAAQSLTPLPEIRADNSGDMLIEPPDGFDHWTTLKSIVNNHPGNCSVHLSLFTDNNCRVRIELSEKVKPSLEFVDSLEEILPAENLRFAYKKGK